MWSAIIVCAVVLFVLLVVLGLRERRRRDEALIRAWADDRGYAVLDIRGPTPSLFAIFLFSLLGPLMWLVSMTAGTLSYFVMVQDEEGGQQTIEVSVRLSAGLVEPVSR